MVQEVEDGLSFDVAGKLVLITGGTGGIGSAFAHAFAERGAVVVATDLRAPAAPFGHAAIRYEQLDVCDTQAVAALAKRMERLDVLIHCAGALAPFKEHEPAVFERIVDIHLVGSMRLATSFRPLLKQVGGTIILVGSIYSFFGHGRVPAYAAAKAGMLSLTKSLAIAYAGDGIRVNGIAPGWINTEMSRGGKDNADINATIMSRLPSQRWAEPTELAGTALFLASPASSLINGVMIPVDGGYSAA